MRSWMNEPLRAHTTFQIGGPAEELAAPESEEELLALLARAPALVLGAGSNLLVRDAGVAGLTVLLGKDFARIEIEGETIFAQAGARLSHLAQQAMRAGLAGLEFAAGIPGSVGGAVAMNAGAYGGQISDVLEEARVAVDGKIVVFPREAMEFGYRTSLPLAQKLVVAGARFRLHRDDPAAIAARMADFAQRRREKQPLSLPSAGSVFKRPEGHFAGALIEGAGLKGLRVGGAQVSEKHAGFIVNTGGATAADVLALVETIRARVREKYGVELEGIVKHIQDLLLRFTNAALKDTCKRVGGDPKRKLSPADRMIGSATLCQSMTQYTFNSDKSGRMPSGQGGQHCPCRETWQVMPCSRRRTGGERGGMFSNDGHSRYL